MELIITTTGSVEGYVIERYLGVVSQSASASYKQYAEDEEIASKYGALMEKAMLAIKEKSKTMGADGIVGVTISHSVDSSNEHWPMILLSITGTAVKLSDENELPEL